MGFWNVCKHGAGKRRTWTKAHFLVDYKGKQILGLSVTADYVGDNLELPNLINVLPERIRLNITELHGDGAHNTTTLYKFLEENNNIRLIAPPAKNSKPNPKLERGRRNHDVERCIEVGQEAWKNR